MFNTKDLRRRNSGELITHLWGHDEAAGRMYLLRQHITAFETVFLGQAQQLAPLEIFQFMVYLKLAKVSCLSAILLLKKQQIIKKERSRNR